MYYGIIFQLAFSVNINDLTHLSLIEIMYDSMSIMFNPPLSVSPIKVFFYFFHSFYPIRN